MEESLSGILQKSPEDIRGYSPLALAFVGDGIFDLVIRTIVMTSGGNRPVKKLHRDKAALVNAHAQAQMAEYLQDRLTDEERDILRRGRNAHPATTAKNQTLADYRAATGLEALCGWLYMTGQIGRLLELVEAGLEGAAEGSHGR